MEKYRKWADQEIPFTNRDRLSIQLLHFILCVVVVSGVLVAN